MIELTKALIFIKEYIEIQKKIKVLEDEAEFLKADIRIYLEQNSLKNIETDNGDSATLSYQTRETLDKIKVRNMIGDEKYAEVVKITKYPMMKIMSKESKENMNRFLGVKNETA